MPTKVSIYWLTEPLPMLAQVLMQYVYWALFQSEEMTKIFTVIPKQLNRIICFPNLFSFAFLQSVTADGFFIANYHYYTFLYLQ